MNESLTVSVVCVAQKQAFMHGFQLPAGSTVADVVTAARMSGAVPVDQETAWSYAIFGQRAEPATPLRDGDRVELLQPLRCDPKENRRQRARAKPDRSIAVSED